MADRASGSFWGVFLGGLFVACLLAGVGVWITTKSTLQQLQEPELGVRSQQITAEVARKLDQRFRGLAYASRQPDIQRAITGVQDAATLAATLDDLMRLYPDLARLEVYRLDAPLQDRTRTGDMNALGAAARDLDMPLASWIGAMIETPDAETPRLIHRGPATVAGIGYVLAGVPISLDDGAQGLLLGAFALNLDAIAAQDPWLESVTLSAAPAVGAREQGVLALAQPLDSTGLSLIFRWSLAQALGAGQAVTAKIALGPIAGLLVAFGCLIWIGKRMILDPQQYMEAAQTRADASAREAQAARQRLEEAIDALDDGFIFYDEQDRLVTFNKAYAALIGPAGAQMKRGQSYAEITLNLAQSGIVPEARGREEDFVRDMIRARHQPDGIDKIFMSDTGKWIHQRDKHTRSGALVGLRVDVTEMKQRELELEEARIRAEAASHAKSNFLANMSHEIRTPMNGIIGMCELLRETALSSEQTLCARTINDSAQALLTIINNLLDFSKIEAGKQELQITTFCLRDVVFDVARLLHPAAQEKAIELCVDYHEDLPALMVGDDARLRQVLVNLVGNAIKFTETGHVLIWAAEGDPATGGLSLGVRDTGIGIPPDRTDAIFEVFEQVDNEATRRYDGAGLGLAITRKIVELMSGEISVSSTLGKGSCFRITLPLETAVDLPAETDPTVYRALLGGKRVLVVDDLDVNRQLLARQLSWVGAEPVTAASGEDALDLYFEASGAGGRPFDLCLIDRHMPEMDGELAFAALCGTDQTPPFPTVLLTTLDDGVDSALLREAGFAATLIKPASHVSLLDCLARVLAPIDTLSTSAPEPPAPPQSVSIDRPLRVFAAEDNRTNQLVLRKMLDTLPVVLDLYSNGQEILDAYRHSPADLIFMDVSMPVMGGIEATEMIRQHEASAGLPGCPIVALTAKALKHHRAECLAAGMTAFLTKPIRKRELAEAIETYGAPAATPVESAAAHAPHPSASSG